MSPSRRRGQGDRGRRCSRQRASVAVSVALTLAACVTMPVTPEPVARPAESPRPVESPPDPRVAPRRVLADFVAAVESKDFAAALALLSHDWRARYDATRLARDFSTEPLGEARVKRLKLHLDGAIELSGHAAVLPLGEGARAALVVEQGGWKISAIE